MAGNDFLSTDFSGSGLAQPIQNGNFLADLSIKSPEIGFNGGINPTSLAGNNTPNGLDLGFDSKGPGFDFGNAFSNFSLGARGIAGLAGAYSAFQQSKLLKDQLRFQKGITNRNLANSAVVTNNSLANQGDLAAQLTTGAEFGTPEHLAARERLTKTVDGSPV